MSRRAVQRLCLVVAAVGLVAASAIAFYDGFEFVVAGLTLRANRIDRLLWLSALSVAIYLLTGGRVWRPSEGHRVRRLFQAAMRRRVVQRLCLVVAAVGLVAAWAIQHAGGYQWTLAGLTIRANRIDRLLWLSGLSVAVYFLTGGQIWRPSERNRVRWLFQPHAIAVTLSLAVLGLGVFFGSKTVGGSDSYGYMSQAQAWMSFGLPTPQPWAAEVPWPNAAKTFAPLGYHVGIDGSSLVPMYAPGFPMLMALAALVGGSYAAFLVVPVAGAVAVYATYRIGLKLHSPWVGLAAAWMVASSPVFVEMLLQTMSDVPNLAAWVVAFLLALNRRSGAAFASGLATALAVLVRVNHAPLALVLVAWFAADAYSRRSTGVFTAGRSLMFYVLGALPGALGLALINWAFYGSPFNSGYGDFSYWFRVEHVVPNLQRYPIWLTEIHTPIVWAGVVALGLPLSRLWPDERARRMMVCAAVFIALLGVEHVFYAVFEDWRFLRFLLAGAPFLFIAMGALASVILRPVPAGLRAVIVCAVLTVPPIIASVDDNYGWRIGAAQRHYVTAAEATEKATAPSSVILAMQHSGSLRYYGQRMTLRYDFLPREELESVVAWMAERGVHPYALLEGWEVELWRQYFIGTSGLVRLHNNPIVTIDSGTVALYDLLSPGPEVPEQVFPTEADEVARPLPPPLEFSFNR